MFSSGQRMVSVYTRRTFSPRCAVGLCVGGASGAWIPCADTEGMEGGGGGGGGVADMAGCVI